VSKGNTTENDLLKTIFQNVALPAYGSIYYIALHTADPGEAGDQTTSEATYPDYARVAVARTAGGWAVVGNAASNVAEITFPECNASFGAGTQSITHVSIGVAASGASQILYSGALTAPGIIVSALDTPRFPASALVIEED
jgi:hypothetical protein